MIVMLLATIVVVCGSGWLYTTDAYWGVEWVSVLHDTSSNVLVLLIIVHVMGVVFTSWWQHENLVAAMVSSRKRAVIKKGGDA